MRLGDWILWPEFPSQDQSLRPGRPESPVLRAGVSTQKISNNMISAEFSPINCKRGERIYFVPE
jgi:hypothetical protein